MQDKGGGVIITTPQELEDALRAGNLTASGASVTPNTAMRVAAVYACVRIISGAVATLPLHIKKRVDERTRKDASDSPLWKVLRRRPNRWQTPSQFRRMLHAHLLLRGNAYAMIVWSRGIVQELIPLHPDRVEVKQNDDLSLTYVYTRKNGTRIELPQKEVFHLVGLTLDGVHGVSALTYARETIGLSRYVGSWRDHLQERRSRLECPDASEQTRQGRAGVPQGQPGRLSVGRRERGQGADPRRGDGRQAAGDDIGRCAVDREP
jgi:phage portal protein BeeE